MPMPKKPRAKCLNCVNEVSRPACHGYKYCSQRCQVEYQYQDWINKWLAGEVDGVVNNGTGTSSRIKRYFIELYGEKCMNCGWNERNPTNNKIPIALDHIDGNSCNNRPENLRLLCPNCHSLTPTYGMLNKGNGRKNRVRSY